MKNVEATIANIHAQLTARGWTITESLDGEGKDSRGNINDCYIELIHTETGERRSLGYFQRVYFWTEAYEAITGRSWLDAVVKK